MKQFKLWNTLCGWIAFAVAATVYLLTIEPTASFWDCGEFISSAHKLDVGHPPGAPFFMLMGHFFSLFASDAGHVAMCVNAMSALASAFTILFLFWTITALAKKLVVNRQDKDMTVAQMIGILGAGMVGALAYTFSDTFWFSAVEGEVYASSSLFTAIVFWLILKWDECADEEGSDRWLILIAYLMGLSIGVHLLNLLTIPAIVLVYYFRRYEFSWKGTFVAFLASVVILAVVLYGIIPGSVQMACWSELLFVNTFGCPFNTGLAIYLVLLICSLVWAIYETYAEKSRVRMNIAVALAVTLAGIPFFGESVILGIILIAGIVAALFLLEKYITTRWLNTSMVMLTVILIGYASYATIVIRSTAQTPMDQNSPDNVFSLKYYLNREQYGDRPLFYGAVYNAPVKRHVEGMYCAPVEKTGHAQYAPDPESAEKGKDQYLITGYKTSYEKNDDFMMLFPRMYSSDSRHVQAYKDWGRIKGTKVRYDDCGQTKTEYKPTFIENMRFFFSYQCNFMYWRYFMWNFAGRQNDLQGYGELTKGNWISGIPFIDNPRLGDQSQLPTELKENKGHNVYYMLPLLLGIIGIIYQFTRKDKVRGQQNFILTFLLFFLTGLAIVVYLNQTPYQPRERDYAYAGSFYAFCIWIGLGVTAIIDFINRFVKGDKQWAKTAVAVGVSVVCLGVPALMGQQNWDDHDRSDRYACRDFGANYLKSLDENAIIFSNGDNDTFPLWYNQEVEGVGTDARVCNLSYLQTDWYIDQMRRPYYASDALPINWEPKDYIAGKNEVVYVDNKLNTPISVKDAFGFVRSNDPRTKIKGESYIPSNRLYIPIDKAMVTNSPVFQENGTCRYQENQIDERMTISLKNYITRSDLMVLEMLSSGEWQRPIYYAVTVGDSYYQNLDKYFELTGLAYQITPVASADGKPRVNTEKMYDNMMHKFLYGNMNKPGIYIDENTMRMCRTHRMMFATLAEALLSENQPEKALEVLDYSEEMLPGCNVPYDYTSVQMAGMYYALGENEKANRIIDNVANNSAEYLMFGSTLSDNQVPSIMQTLYQQTSILGYSLEMLRRNGEEELFDKYYDYYRQYAVDYK